MKQYGLNADVGAPKWTLTKNCGIQCGVAHFLSSFDVLLVHNRASSTTSSSFMSSKYSNDIVMDSDFMNLPKEYSCCLEQTNTRTSTEIDLNHSRSIDSYE